MFEQNLIKVILTETEWSLATLRRKLEAMGVPASPGTLSTYHRGHRKIASYPLVLALCDIAREKGIDVDQLWEAEKKRLVEQMK